MIPSNQEMETAGNPTSQYTGGPNAGKVSSGSAQLNRWSRARAVRSGRKLDHPFQHEQQQHSDVVDQQLRLSEGSKPSISSPYFSSSSSEDGNGGEVEETPVKRKEIYMISDGSGRTAEHSVNAALGQFEHFLVDRGFPVNTRLFSGKMLQNEHRKVAAPTLLMPDKRKKNTSFPQYLIIINDVERLMEIIMQAAKEHAMLIYTLADEKMANSARHACKTWGVQSTDVLRPITKAIATHLGVTPSGLPRGAPGRNFPMTENYFKRINAVEFTIKQDDGAFPENLHKADIVVLGVSRSGKTPLSIYLAQKGYKVANVPIVKGVELPKCLFFKVDQKKVFALTINPVMLQSIRRARANGLGVDEDEKSKYHAEMAHVREEIEYASKIFAKNPTWPVIEVTGKAIEEIAAIVLRLYQDKKHMPTMSKLY